MWEHTANMHRQHMPSRGIWATAYHRDHDRRAKNPEDVIEEEASQQDDPCRDCTQGQVLNALYAERQPQGIVSQPMLLFEVPAHRSCLMSGIGQEV